MSGDISTAPSSWALGLAHRIAQGDGNAEREFVERYARGIKVLMQRHCRRDEPSIPDLVQDVLVAVLQRLRAGALREDDALSSYIQKTAMHMASAEYRRQAKQPTAADDVLQTLHSETNLPIELDQARVARIVRDLVAGMETPRDRELLRRFYIEECSKEDVCTALGIDHHHFHRVVFRARQRLREKLEAAGLGPRPGETTGSRRTLS